MIRIPTVRRPYSGLVKLKSNWMVIYFQDGKMYRKSTGTKDADEAAAFRDRFYANLREQGALDTKDCRKNSTPPKEKIQAGRDLYVYRQKPFFVQIQKRRLGYYDTAEEARAARDAYLGVEAEPPKPKLNITVRRKTDA